MAGIMDQAQEGAFTPTEEEKSIYLSLDHLSAGSYVLKITLENEIIEKIRINKD